MWTHPDLEAVATLFTARTGIPITAQRQPYVEAGIRRAMLRLKVTDIPTLRERVAANPEALDEIIKELAVGETYFFREPSHFEFVRRRFLPELFEGRGEEHVVRAWSAGCSTGEEPYSLAILFEDQGIAGRSKILASDVSRPAIEMARLGTYRSWSLRGEGAAQARPFLTFHDARWHLDERIKERVEFRLLNLVADPFPSHVSGVWEMDLIFCRNVLIYFSRETIGHVAKKLAESLAPGGVLVTGPSDPLLANLAPLEAFMAKEGVFYRRRELAMAAVATNLRPHTLPCTPAIVESPGRVVEPAPRASEKGKATEAMMVRDVRELGNLDVEEAAVACEKALALYPLSTELRYLHAHLLLSLGQTQEAEREARRVLYLDRTLAVGHALLGTILKRRGDLEAARRSFRNAWRICAAMPAEAEVPLADGESAGILGGAAASEVSLLAGALASPREAET